MMKLQTILMSYDEYERHAVVSRILKNQTKNLEKQLTVLDVGGRARLLDRFIPYQVTSVNPDGSGHLSADGCALPFVGSSFDSVVSIDTLEHVPRENRLPFLRECMRVARQSVVVAAPYGSAGHRQFERKLNDMYARVHGKPHAYLSDHIVCGLPDESELDFYERELPARSFERLFSGDYLWQGRCLERTIDSHCYSGLIKKMIDGYNLLYSLAIFHPIRLRKNPEENTNRFFLHLKL